MSQDDLRCVPLRECSRPVRELAFLVNFGFHEWYRAMVPYMKARAAQYGARLRVLDCRMDVELQTRQLDDAAADGAAAVIMAPVREQGLERAVAAAAARGVPVVCESSLVPGACALVAADDYEVGRTLGAIQGRRLAEAGVPVRLLDVTYFGLASVMDRSRGLWDALVAVAPEARLVARVDGDAEVERAREAALGALDGRPDLTVGFGMDDESAVGLARAVQTLGYADVPVLGCGLSGPTGHGALLDSASPYALAAAMFPEYVGVMCVDAAIGALETAGAFERIVTPHVAMDADCHGQWFASVDSTFRPDLAAVERLAVGGGPEHSAFRRQP